MNRKTVVPMKRLACIILPILVALSFVSDVHGDPFVPLAWQRLVDSGPLYGMRKHVGWIHDINGDFIDDAFDTLAPGEETQVIVQLNECFGSFEDYKEYFRPYGVAVYKGVLVAYVILDHVPQERLRDLADDPRVAALEYPRTAYANLDTSTRAVRARASITHGTSTFPNVTNAGNGSGVTIAIVDSGVDDSHSAFAGSYVGGYDAVSSPAGPGNPDDDWVNIHTGLNGVCQSTAISDDVQQIPLNQGQPNMACVLAGPNGILNSIVGGDDTTGTLSSGAPAIGTGANGVCETNTGGDDNQLIQFGQGARNQPCILPGANGQIDTTQAGDDSLEEVFHGTHVAAIALGRGGAGTGDTRNADDGSTPNNGTGMAPGASLLDVKVLDSTGSGAEAAILKALDWIFKNGQADVVNMSLGASEAHDGTSVVSKAVDALVARDIAVAVSVGNSGSQAVSWPADSEFATTVAWVRDQDTVSASDDTVHGDSTFGPRADYNKNKLTVGMLKPDIGAPGTDIMSARGNTTNDYHALGGSSMASPHVAGAMALLIELGRNMTPQRHIPPGALKDLLKRTADRSMPSHSAMDSTVDSDYDEQWGYGLLNVYEAAKQLEKGVADVSFPAAIGPHPQYPDVRPCLITGGKAHYENDLDIHLATDPPVLNQLNTVSVDIENRSSTTAATNVVVSIGIIDFGVGGQVYDGNSITVKNLPASGTTTVQFNWRPSSTSHQCIQATIDYGLDSDFTNNCTQRNINQINTSSPGESSFLVRNPLNEHATIILEPRLDPVTQKYFSIEMSATQFDMEPEDCPELVDIQFFPNPGLPPGTTGRVDISATAYSESYPEGIELTGVVFYVTVGGPAEMVQAFAFGSRQLDCPTYNDPATNYTIVYHGNPEDLAYDPNRGWGYEVIYPEGSPYGDRSGYGVFGPFDDSPNNRDKFPDECPEELYDSFIGAKDFTDECSEATIGDPCTPCAPTLTPEGIIFRVDVPNGLYRFVGAFGDADNVHAHRILAEDGGSGPPEEIGSNHVVLVSNFDQAQQTIGEADPVEFGEGVYARVGFDGKIPPPGDGVYPSPQFVNMDQDGLATDGPANSPTLEVTQGYIRIHQLQGNSNDGPGGPRDGNGGDMVILELWKIDEQLPEPDIENLVLNPSFEEDEDVLDDPDWYAWATWNPAEGAGSNATIVDTDSPDGTRSLFIEPIGPENWHFIVLSLPIPTEVGAGYTASFWARAAEPRPLGVQFKATDNTESWGYAGFDLTTEWAEYTLTAAALNAEIKLEFFCAGSEVPFWLDFVSVYQTSPGPPPVECENLLTNGGFEDGADTPLNTWEPLTWNLYGDASMEVVTEDAIEGDYCLQVTVHTAGANFWDAGLQHTGHVFDAGKNYILSAFVKSRAGTMEINFKPERAADPWEGYGEQVFTMTEEWQEFSVTTGIIPDNVDPAALTFHIAFTAGEFLIDDVKFCELE